MLSRTRLGFTVCKRMFPLVGQRGIASSAFCMQQAPATGAAADPIQKLFVDKIHEYAQKSKSSGGKLVDASPATEKALADEMEKLGRMYGAKGADFAKFPTFNFTDPDLEPVGVNAEIKDEELLEEEEEEFDDRPYFEPDPVPKKEPTSE